MPDKEKSDLERARQAAGKAAEKIIMQEGQYIDISENHIYTAATPEAAADIFLVESVKNEVNNISPEAMKAAAQTAARTPEGSAQAAQEVQKAIVVNTDIDENASEIGFEELSKMAQSAQESLSNISLILQEALKNVAKSLENYNTDILKGMAESLRETADTLNKMFESKEWHEIESLFPGITTDDFFDALVILEKEYDPEGTPTIDGYINLFRELTRLLPYIPAVLEAYKKESGLKEITFIQFLENKDPATGKPAESLFNKCLRQAKIPNSELLNKKLLPMVHGKATDAIATMAGQNTTFDPYSKSHSITRRGAKLVLKSENGATLENISVSAHKLLSVAMYSFSENNGVSATGRNLRNFKVSIPLKEYAIMCGYDVEEHATITPEEAAKEAQRAQNALKKARRKVKRDLDTLFFSYASWSENVKGKHDDFYDVRIISARGIEKGFIKITFSVEMAEYLIQLPLTQYPVALLKLDERNPNAYSMGVKISEHFNMDNNQKRGTAQLLKVSTLLGVTNLPDIKTLRKQRMGWETRIKEPFENALDALTQCGLLSDWRYSKPKGEEMTDFEATSLSTFEKWSNTLVYFTMNDIADNEQRLKNKAARIEKQQSAADKKKKSGKKSAR